MYIWLNGLQEILSILFKFQKIFTVLKYNIYEWESHPS